MPKSIFQYGVVGVGGYVFHLLLLTVMVEFFAVDPVLASIVSFIPVLIVSYKISYSWVFSSDRDHKTAFKRYLVVTGIGFMLNTLIMYTTIHWLDWWYIHSQGIVFIVVAANNFLLNYY